MQRRLLLAAAALLACLGPAASVQSPGGGAQVVSQFQGTMALAHHDKVVKKTQKQLESLLVQEGRELGEAIGRYAGELGEASRYLQAAINASQAQVTASPETKARSKLSADIGQAERMQRQIGKQQEHVVRSAVGELGVPLVDLSPLEDLSPLVFSSLERKLGDLSPMVEAAKRELEAAAASSLEAAASSLEAVTGNSTAASSLEAASGALTAATKRSKSEVDAANSRLDKTISQIMEQVVNSATAIEASMERAEEKELRRLPGGGGAQAAPSETTNLV